jgi:hypothetical protein
MSKLNTVQNGKGSKPRPIKNHKKYIENWDAINWSKPNPKPQDSNGNSHKEDLRS